MVAPLILLIVSGIFGIFGTIFKNPIMQLIGGAILIYFLSVWHILPTWIIILLVILFIYLIKKK